MSAAIAFETFGVPGIILFGLGYLMYKVHQNYILYIACPDFLNKCNPQKTLSQIWENGESPKREHHNWCRYYYGKKVELNGMPVWKIDLSPIDNGSMFIYTSYTELPIGLEDGKYFFSIKFKNLKPHIEVMFEKKCFYGANNEHIAAKYKYNTKQEIVSDGTHYFEPTCCIGEEEGDGDDRNRITKEQIGVYIKPKDDQPITDLIIEEAYIGKKCWKINLLPCIGNRYYLVVEPRKHEAQ